MKNILFIFTDQWRGDCLSATGHKNVFTPHLDDLSNDSMVFDRAYAQAPSCIPARACVVTGKCPNSTGFIGYQDGVVWDYDKTMMSLLRDNGYQTINVGKTHFFPQRAHLGFEINHVYDPISLVPKFKSDYHIFLEKETRNTVHDTASTFDGNAYVHYPWKGDSYLHPTEWTADTAIQDLENRDVMRPFFMQLSFHRPHPPYDPPQFFFDMYKDQELDDIPCGAWSEIYSKDTLSINDWQGSRNKKALDTMRKAYYASISHVDYCIGKVLTYLKHNKLYDDTLILFTSDHGELLGDHHMYRKISPFEGSAKLPFIVKDAHQSNCFSRCDTPVSHFDIMPTCLNFAGIKIPSDVEGKDILPLTKKDAAFDRTYLHGEHSGYGDNGWQFIVDKQFKYIWNTKTGKELMFDLNHDPQELVDLCADDKNASLVAQYREKLIACLKDREENLVVDGQLAPGQVLPAVKKAFLQNSLRLREKLSI